MRNIQNMDSFLNESSSSGNFKGLTLVDNQWDIYSVDNTKESDGFQFFVKPMKDTTHFYMSNDMNVLQSEYPSGAAVWHIGQHRNKPYYDDVQKMLRYHYRKNNR